MKEKHALIYVVEDDEGIQEVYRDAFEDEYDMELFSCGGEFFDRLAQRRPDLVLLDIMLPDMDGFTILTKLRQIDEKLPVIIVSARQDEISFVKGLNKGADDYMAKPFSILELMARVKTNLRRAQLYITNAGGFTVDQNTYKIFYNGKDLKLTLKEYKLLRLLINHAGITVERDALFTEGWGDSFMGETRTLDMHMAALREKMRQVGADASCLVTVRGIGYRFEAL